MLEEVVVTGIRASLQAAVDVKRDSVQISDAIVAEDIGKLPDNNIAEALQRITGVSIVRDFGVGTSVSIRGLPQNRIELNGRSTIGDGRGGVSLEDFPSSFLKQVEVIKSPTADMIEGALGGTVRMETRSPLELDGPTIAGYLAGEYTDKTENWGPIFNATAGDNWDLGEAGTIGAVAMFSYQDRELRRDSYFNRVQALAKSDAGDGSNPEDAIPFDANTPSGRYIVRDQNTVEQYVEERERTASFVSVEWAPASEDGHIFLEYNTTSRGGYQGGNSILDVGGTREYDANTVQDANGQVDNYTLPGVFQIPKTWSEFRETDTETIAFGADWDLTDKLNVFAEYVDASSESSAPDNEFNLRPVRRADFEADGSINMQTADAEFDGTNGGIPSIVYSDPNLLTNPNNLALREFEAELNDTTNDETAFRIDVDYREPFGIGWISSVEAGYRQTERDYSFRRAKFEQADVHSDTYYLDENGNPTDEQAVFWINDYEAMFPGSITTVNYDNSFDQTGLAGQNDLLTYRVFDPMQLHNIDDVFLDWQQLYQGTTLETSGTLSDNMTDDLGAYRDITEETSALYAMANLDFGAVRANVGVRYVESEISSSDADGDSGSNDYDDVLPSANITYSVTDNTLVRFAAAKVMRRAGFEQLAPSAGVDDSYVTAERGAIDLDPFRATQYDLSVEHYFGDTNMISAAIFYKDVSSFFTTSSSCVADSRTQSAPQNVTEYGNVCLLNSAGQNNPTLEYVDSANFANEAEGIAYVEGLRDQGLTGIRTYAQENGDSGFVKGLELGYQQIFDFLPGMLSGLGMNANYTYADSETPDGSQMLNISEHTINTQVFWEYEDVSVRFAYNWRDDFLFSEQEKRVENIGALATNSSQDDPTAGNNYTEARGQLDFSVSYDINDNISLVGNATNLTGENTVFITELGSPWQYYESDRRYSVGVRAKF
nr:TonB-dependent receptor [Gilvimarinus xylanilyticus]